MKKMLFSCLWWRMHGWLYAICFFLLFSAILYGKDQVTLQLKWDHEFQFAGYYAALWQGYYQDVGLDVTIRSRVKPDGSLLDIGDELAAGNADFAVAGPDLLIYRDQGIPVVILASVFQRSPYGFITRKDRFTTAVEFEGMRINQTEPTWGPVELDAIMRAVGGHTGGMIISTYPPNLSLLRENKVDIIATYITSATWQMKEMEEEFDIYSASDYGVYLYGDTLITHQRMVEKHPDTVEAFTKASLKGWRYALENTDEIATKIARDLPLTFKFYQDFAAYNRHEAQDIIKLTYYPTVTLGHTSEDRWQKVLEYFRQAGHVKNIIDINDLIYNPEAIRAEQSKMLKRVLLSATILGSSLITCLFFWSYTLRTKVKQKTEDLRNLNFSLEDKVVERTKQLDAELRSRKEIEQTLRVIAEEVFSTTGEDFFRSLVCCLTKILHVKYAFVGELSPDNNNIIDTIAFSEHGRIVDNIQYHLHNTPCEVVVGKELCLYPDNLATLFPQDPMLVEMKLKSYCGAPLICIKEEALGLLVVLDTHPLKNENLVRSIMKIMGSRASQEMVRKRAEEVMQNEKERFSVMLRSIGDGIIATDMKENIILINEVAENLTGWSHNDAVGKHLMEILQIVEEKTGKPCENLAAKTIKSGTLSLFSEHVILKAKDGIERFITDSFAPIRDHNSQIIGVIIVFRDITRQRKMEAEKLEIERQLLQLQKAETIGTLAGGIAHEFNNILMPILNYAELSMNKTDKTNSVYNYLNCILKASYRAKDLVQQILTFGRQDGDQLHQIKVEKVINEAVQLILSIVPKTIKIRKNIQSGCGTILADESKIHQVIVNICTNAYHAMPKGGTLTVALNEITFDTEVEKKHPNLQPGRYIEIVISDTGCGMDTVVQKRIFDPFFTTKGVGKGTGLGLSVVHGILTRHHGDITVNSQVGKGSTFRIYLPVVRDTEEKMKNIPRQITGGQEQILFVEDEKAIADMGKIILEEYGYSVSVYTSSVQALEAFQNSPNQFDLVISDYTMPSMTGIVLGKKMLQIRPDIPIILMTGYDASVTEEILLSQGFRALIMKPVTSSELQNVIEKVLYCKQQIFRNNTS